MFVGQLDNDIFTVRDDVVVGTLRRGILWYPNDDGEFTTLPIAIDSDLTLDTISLAVGDVNGDGFPDIVAGNYGQQNRLYLNNGNGTFATGVPFGAILNTTEVGLANINGDAKPELIVATDKKAFSFTLRGWNVRTDGNNRACRHAVVHGCDRSR
jgi:hypothetical protein